MASPDAAGVPPEHLVFLHIPKTGGTTIRAALASAYAPSERVFLYHPSVRGAVTVEDFEAWPEERRAAIRLAFGHVSFGLHEHLPGASRYVAMVREPIDRLVSLFYFFKSGRFPSGSDPARQQERLAREDIGIDEYVFEDRHPRWDNQMVRLLAGPEKPPFGAVDERLLTTALANVDSGFEALLIQERMSDSMRLLETIAGRRPPRLVPSRGSGGLSRVAYRLRDRGAPVIPWRNATAGRPDREELDPAALASLVELNRHDIELYRVARERFDERVGVRRRAWWQGLGVRS